MGLAHVGLSGCAALRGIGAYAFEDCPLEVVLLSGCSSVGSIGTRAFSGSALTAIDLAACTALTGIDDDAFADCEALAHLSFPLSLVYIGKDAFAGCEALRSVNLNGCKALRRIRSGAFTNTKVELFNFKGCTELRCINEDAIPHHVDPTIDFAECVGLMHIHCSLGAGDLNLEASRKLVTIGDHAFFHPLNTDITETDKLTLPPELPALELIGKGAFRDCSSSCDFSKSHQLLSIVSSAFSHYSSNLISFAGCTALEWVGEYAFHRCSVSVIDLSRCASLSSVGEGAFLDCTAHSIDLSNCTLLVQVDPRTFEHCSAGLINLSHCAALGLICERAFCNCTAVHTIDLSGCTALESIGLNVFEGCAALASLDISDSTLFEGFQKNSLCCPALETLRLPADAPMRELLADAFGLKRTNPVHETLAKVTFVHTSAFKEANPCWFETVNWGLKRAMEVQLGEFSN